jgi:hypothetical protein
VPYEGAAETTPSINVRTMQQNYQQSLQNYIHDCTATLQRLNNSSIGSSSSSQTDGATVTLSEAEEGKRRGQRANNKPLQTRGEVLCRQAKAMGSCSNSVMEDSSSSSRRSSCGSINTNIIINPYGIDIKEKNLNAAAKDLLQLLSFDPKNSNAVMLLRSIRLRHGAGGRDGDVAVRDSEASSRVERTPIS